MGKAEDAYEKIYGEMADEAFEIIVLCLTRGWNIDTAVDEVLGEGSAKKAREQLGKGGFIEGWVE